MGLTATAGSGQAFKRVPAGVWVGRCISVIDLGTQSVEFQGDHKMQHKCVITWEVLGEDEMGVPLTVEVNGKETPMTISKRYTVSLNEKASLRKDLAAWRGRDFTADELKAFAIDKLLGAYCMVNVTHNENNGKTYANIASITPLPAALNKVKPKSDTPVVRFDLDEFDQATFDGLADYWQGLIKDSEEWKAKHAAPAKAPPKMAAAAAGAALEDMDDDIPF